MNNVLTLSEYRMMHPHSASVPTVTQSGLLDQVLERHRQHAARLEMQRARHQQLAELMASCAGELQELAAGVMRVCANAIDSITSTSMRLKSMFSSKLTNQQRYPRDVMMDTNDRFGDAAREHGLHGVHVHVTGSQSAA